jgi:glycosyltransferase involved in cell wall biosynthesis
MSTSPATLPLVSVVTPFFNTAPYLAECIESVLAQSFTQFEYILMDNCSTDGSAEIAARYASRDSRIRLIRCSEFLSQLGNYNRALHAISDASTYCKIVQADDWIFPECLERMVQAFEQSESIGLVSSYWLEGKELRGAGLSPRTTMIEGRECARWYLRTATGIFGTQTQVMYRSSLVRCHEAFYNIGFAYADLQKHIEILEKWDFGFVHQVLSFSRRDNDEESILRSFEAFEPYYLLRYLIAQHYAPVFLEVSEAASIIAKYKREYYRCLARAAFELQGHAFWRFHKEGINALNEDETHDWLYLAMLAGPELLWLASNPGMAFRSWKQKMRAKRAASGAGSRAAEIASRANESLEG